MKALPAECQTCLLHCTCNHLRTLCIEGTKPEQPGLVRFGGDTVSMARLAEEMFELGGLRRKPVAPYAGDIRYRILRPFKKHLADGFTREEMDGLVKSVPGVGLIMDASSWVIE